VSTRGKVPEWDNIFKTIMPPVDTEIPVVVLLDKGSASASEVVSGALQDFDRAVVMGQRSYGKGLVQNTRELGYNARVKLTTAKYYTPSGRCIQSVRYKNGEPVEIPEAERGQFKTRNGRIVTDGGGIKPDVVLPHDTATGVVKALLDQNMIFDYVTDVVLAGLKIDSIETYSFSDWDGFTKFVQQKNFDYQTWSEKKLAELRDIAARENLSLGTDIAALENKVKTEKKGELTRNKARIMKEIEQEIIGRYFFQKGKVRKNLNNDSEIEEAVKLLNDPERYKGILAGKKL
jgi:carboxyl-terminal processing protease